MRIIYWQCFLPIFLGVPGVTLPELLQFITGTSVIPAMGFVEKPQLSFIHGCDKNCKCFPSASTCALHLQIPVHLNKLEEMKDSFSSALKDGFVFGIIWLLLYQFIKCYCCLLLYGQVFSRDQWYYVNKYCKIYNHVIVKAAKLWLIQFRIFSTCHPNWSCFHVFA